MQIFLILKRLIQQIFPSLLSKSKDHKMFLRYDTNAKGFKKAAYFLVTSAFIVLFFGLWNIWILIKK
ncbi:hypothetical protein AB834_05455 [PVC group bacterium (ex Bugula neritina AB1)]|nr:hypothetical protein AB834_05455 [PVC group bacterium (ex Bugula neritina AB1)]